VIPQAAAARPPPRPIEQPAARVMICDDSVVIRGAIARMLETEPGIRVVARATNGAAALAELQRQPIDVIVLDIEMPVMDGLTALPLLLKADPSVRIIMASTLTTRGADVALQALRLGAADYVPKPSTAAIQDDSFRRELLAKIHGLARIRRATQHNPGAVQRVPHTAFPARAASPTRPSLLAIGSSTGGPQALFTLVQGLGPTLSVPVVLTQHMPRTFTRILAEHLTRLGGMPCHEAEHGEQLKAGHIYLAPGDRHLCVDANAAGLRVRLTEDPPENFCRPSVDPMLRTASLACAGRVLMVMLTGMGQDGLAATRDLIQAGGTALAQDETTSVVWGMPGAIAQAGLCHAVLPLPLLAAKIRDILEARTR
jgi:two-component system chemotaxis response regulator CheB